MKKHASAHLVIVRVSTIATLLALVLLFTLPRKLVHDMHDELMPLAQEATERILLDDRQGAELAVRTLETRYTQTYLKRLLLFVDHEDADSLGSSIRQCIRFAQVQNDQMISELEVIKNILDFMRGIEVFKWYNLF